MKLQDAKFHFIGVGGIGMSALAELLHQMGAQVSGSDLKENSQTQHLQGLGVTVLFPQDAKNITEGVDVVVYSSAIPQSNPEYAEARRRNIPIIPRAEALAEIMRFKRGIAIGGTHGKTTTTSMLASIFMKSELDPTIAVGGRLKLIESTARLGQGPWIVAEADESDGSFSRLSPEICVITNVDRDHLNHFGSFENVQHAFLEFALKIPFYGTAIVNGDDPQTRALFSNFPKKILFYGTDSSNDYQLKREDGHYRVCYQNQDLGTLDIQVPGLHNALNALAACIAAHLAGVDWQSCIQGVNSYSGVDRRFQHIGKVAHCDVYDDYAHHPTEVMAALQGAREKYPDTQIHVVFQPHRYSRTRDCWKDFLTSFKDADHVYLLDIYPAGEFPLEGVSSASMAEQLGDQAVYCEDETSLTGTLSRNIKPNDVIFTMGAGSVWQYGAKIMKALGE